jgi:short-subunit dehydrogenase
MRDVRDTVIVVVGATGGIGGALCAELRSRGAIVLGAGRRGPDIELDLRDSRAGDALVRGALGLQGRLDGVINAAGVVAFGELAQTDSVTIEELFLTNALGPLWLASIVVPALSATKGFFVNISGGIVERPTPGLVSYGASKAALAHALVGLRGEAAALGVHVADLRPPHTATGLESRALSGASPPAASGLEPDVVAARIIDAIEADEAEVPAAAFQQA